MAWGRPSVSLGFLVWGALQWSSVTRNTSFLNFPDSQGSAEAVSLHSSDTLPQFIGRPARARGSQPTFLNQNLLWPPWHLGPRILPITLHSASQEIGSLFHQKPLPAISDLKSAGHPASPETAFVPGCAWEVRATPRASVSLKFLWLHLTYNLPKKFQPRGGQLNPHQPGRGRWLVNLRLSIIWRGTVQQNSLQWCICCKYSTRQP